MGYTHYWRIPSAEPLKVFWPRILADAKLIIKEAGIELCWDEDVSEEPPVLDERSIQLNGRAEAHEPFIFKPAATSFDCCKTARKEYDVVVTAILLRAFQLVGKAIDVSSDGEWDDEWESARALVEKLWPEDRVECPWAEHEEED